MKLSKKLLKALVEQVNMEFASGYLYRSMSHDMKNLALNGYAKWLTEQIEEEVNARDNITGFEKAQEGAALLYMFDNHLGDR